MRINKEYQYRLLTFQQLSNDTILGLVLGLSTFYKGVYEGLILTPEQRIILERMNK